MYRSVALLSGLALAAICLSSNAAEDSDVVERRVHIMNTLGEQVAIVGQIASGAAPETDLNVHLEIIALTASTALKAFEPKVPGGEARPKVWTDWADFSKRMNEFTQKSRDLAKLGKEKGKDAAMAAMVDAYTCKQCHDVYREEKKK